MGNRKSGPDEREEYVLRAQMGDDEAFHELFQVYSDVIRHSKLRFFKLHGFTKETQAYLESDVEDCIEYTLDSAVKNYEQTEASFAHYLSVRLTWSFYQMSKRIGKVKRDSARRKIIELDRDVIYQDKEQNGDYSPRNYHEVATDRESGETQQRFVDKQSYRECLERLTDREFFIYGNIVLLGFDNKYVAQQMDRSEGAISLVMRNVRRKMHDFLTQ